MGYHQDRIGTRSFSLSKLRFSVWCRKWFRIKGPTLPLYPHSPPRHLLPLQLPFPHSPLPSPPARPVSRGSPGGLALWEGVDRGAPLPGAAFRAPSRRSPRPAVGNGLRVQSRAASAPPLRCHLQWSLNASEPANPEGRQPGAVASLLTRRGRRGERRRGGANQRALGAPSLGRAQTATGAAVALNRGGERVLSRRLAALRSAGRHRRRGAAGAGAEGACLLDCLPAAGVWANAAGPRSAFNSERASERSGGGSGRLSASARLGAGVSGNPSGPVRCGTLCALQGLRMTP